MILNISVPLACKTNILLTGFHVGGFERWNKLNVILQNENVLQS